MPTEPVRYPKFTLRQARVSKKDSLWSVSRNFNADVFRCVPFDKKRRIAGAIVFTTLNINI